MAEVKIYRVAYVYDEEDDSGINFSGWVQADGMDEVLAELPTYLAGEEETDVIVLGWEEKTLDTDPEEE